MQTILGAGGAIGIEVARALVEYKTDIRLVSRNPRKVNPDDQLFAADLTDRAKTAEAIKGSSVVYLTAGLPYRIKTWQEQWPVIMRNTIDACKSEGARLVFFDNVYMYDRDFLNPMTEQTPVRPTSRKGAIRAQIAAMLMDEVKSGSLTALIARSADFYGPSLHNVSIMTEIVMKNLHSGKKANWLGALDRKHSFTYTPDAGRATALLGNTDSAFNQIWHLPTAPNPMTGAQWIEAVAREMDTTPRAQLLTALIMRMLGLFIPPLRETVEMLYQYDRDYVFDSSRFESTFKIAPTSYLDGIRQIVQTDFSKKH